MTMYRDSNGKTSRLVSRYISTSLIYHHTKE